ncbi:MAG: hypothetical protein JNM19_19660 [Chitinophagaceae bacterium]|nr:hypothetical protein [Chitinophagaceae bacterium]
MKLLFSGCIVLLMLFGFTSCQREVDGTLTPESFTDSSISRIVVLDTTTFASGLDTAQTIEFLYDGSGRLITFHSVYYNPGVSGAGRFNADEEIRYQYTGADTLPAKLFSKYTDIAGGTTDYDTSFLTYSGGMVARDSFFSAPDYVVAEFNKLSENRYKVFHKINNGMGGQVIDTAYINLTYQNGNLIKEVDSLWLPGGGWTVTSMNVMYDNKPNPLRSISIPYPAPFNQFYLSGIGVAPLSNRSMNNELSEMNSIGTFVLLLSYQYGPTGLPKIIRDDNGLKFFYFYKML